MTVADEQGKADVMPIGHAKTVLIFGPGGGARGVVTTVVARRMPPRRRRRLRFIGPVLFHDEVVRHVKAVILPAIDEVRKSLRVRKTCFEVSVTNFGGASAIDTGARISGFSSDAALFLALLSAALRCPVRGDLVVTGHMASPEGDIRWVRGIPVKVTAALAAAGVSAFASPALDGDTSVVEFVPGERDSAWAALAKARGRLTVVPLRTVTDLVSAAFTDEAILVGALHEGFYLLRSPQPSNSQVLQNVAQRFVENSEALFLNALERQMLEGKAEQARSLLADWAELHIRRRRYPRDFGRKLHQLLCSVPAATRRLKLRGPFLSARTCAQVLQHQRNGDDTDGWMFLRAVENALPAATASRETPPGSPAEADLTRRAEEVLASLLGELGGQGGVAAAVARVDEARASYCLPGITVDSFEDFVSMLAAFHLHVLRHMGVIHEGGDTEMAAAEALSLLDHTFSPGGGYREAFREAQNPTRGGMRYVLDRMAEGMRQEQQRRYVQGCIQDRIDPFDYELRRELVGVIQRGVGAHLPDELADSPPDRFVGGLEQLLIAYVGAVEETGRVFRRI